MQQNEIVAKKRKKKQINKPIPPVIVAEAREGKGSSLGAFLIPYLLGSRSALSPVFYPQLDNTLDGRAFFKVWMHRRKLGQNFIKSCCSGAATRVVNLFKRDFIM